MHLCVLSFTVVMIFCLVFLHNFFSLGHTLHSKLYLNKARKSPPKNKVTSSTLLYFHSVNECMYVFYTTDNCYKQSIKELLLIHVLSSQQQLTVLNNRTLFFCLWMPTIPVVNNFLVVKNRIPLMKSVKNGCCQCPNDNAESQNSFRVADTVFRQSLN